VVDGVQETGCSSSVAFSPDGATLVAAACGNTIRLWRVDNGNQILSIDALNVQAIAYAPDGNSIASGDLDKNVKLWKVADGSLIRTMTGHTDNVLAVAFSPDGTVLASGSSDRSIKLWNPANGAEIRTMTGHVGWVDAVAFSPDGTVLASGSSDNSIKLWNPANGAEIRTMTVPRLTLQTVVVVFSADGTKLYSGDAGSTIRAWQVNNGAVLGALTQQTGRVVAVAFSPDNQTIAHSAGSTVKLRRVKDGSIIRELVDAFVTSGSVSSVAFSPDGTKLVSGADDNRVRIWDVASGAVLQVKEHTKRVTSVAFAPTNQIQMVASGSYDGTAILWNTATGDTRTLMDTGLINAVAFTPDAKVLLTGDSTQTIKIWEVASGGLRTTVTLASAVNTLASSPDGRSFLSGSSDGTIEEWGVDGGHEASINAHTRGVNSLAFSPDPNLFVSGGNDAAVRLTSGCFHLDVTKYDQETGTAVLGVAFASNGKLIAYGRDDGTVVLANQPQPMSRAQLTCPPASATDHRVDLHLVFCAANSGACADTFAYQLSEPLGWIVGTDQPPVGEKLLAPDSTFCLTATVHTPADCPPGEIDSLCWMVRPKDAPAAGDTCWTPVECTMPTPTLVERFEGRAGPGTVELTFSVLDEAGFLGVNVYRSRTGAYAEQRLTPTPITLDGRPLYHLTDRSVEPGCSYQYTLALVQADGRESRQGLVEVRTPLAVFAMDRATPNPTTLGFTLRVVTPANGPVTLRVLDLHGREVSTPFRGFLETGEHFLCWDGRIAGERSAVDGIYFVVLEAAGRRATQRIVVIR